MYVLDQLVSRLKLHYGAIHPPPARGPFELILWENACYLLTDERRKEVFDSLHQQVGLNPAAIDNAPDEILLPLATRGGMRPETRVFRWRQIARITLDQFGGNLDSILTLPLREARRALKQFPNIGDPGADKILLFCDIASTLPLESNGLRVLVRIGYGRLQKDYGATYRSVQADLTPDLPDSTAFLKEAFLLLRTHGQTLCKDKQPLCHQCPAARGCDYAAQRAASFQLPVR